MGLSSSDIKRGDITGLYGTAKMSENNFAYAGISGEARSGQTLGTVNVDLKLQF
jgi:hypothetical protein